MTSHRRRLEQQEFILSRFRGQKPKAEGWVGLPPPQGSLLSGSHVAALLWPFLPPPPVASPSEDASPRGLGPHLYDVIARDDLP